MHTWTLDTLVPWYTWATQSAAGICQTYVDFSANVSLSYSWFFDEGTQWKGYVDANGLPCGLGEVFYVNGDIWTWGTAYAWQGIPYGPIYRIRFGEAMNGTTNMLF